MPMKKLLLLVAGLALIAGAFVVPVDRAEAHSYDGYSTIYCSAYPVASHTLIHAWPYSLQPDILYRVCTWDYFGVRHQVFVGQRMSTGQHWQQGLPQKCAPHGYIICEPHGQT